MKMRSERPSSFLITPLMGPLQYLSTPGSVTKGQTVQITAKRERHWSLESVTVHIVSSSTASVDG